MARYPGLFPPSKIETIGRELAEWFLDENNRYIKVFCAKQGFPSDYISEWARKNRVFARLLKIAKDRQEANIIAWIEKMTEERKNGVFGMFALKNVAGWRDVPEEKQSKRETLHLVVHLPGKGKLQAGKPKKALKPASRAVDAKFSDVEPVKRPVGRPKSVPKP